MTPNCFNYGRCKFEWINVSGFGLLSTYYLGHPTVTTFEHILLIAFQCRYNILSLIWLSHSCLISTLRCLRSIHIRRHYRRWSTSHFISECWTHIEWFEKVIKHLLSMSVPPLARGVTLSLWITWIIFGVIVSLSNL